MGHTYVGIFNHSTFRSNRFQVGFLVLTSHSDANGESRQDDTFGWNKGYDAPTPLWKTEIISLFVTLKSDPTIDASTPSRIQGLQRCHPQHPCAMLEQRLVLVLPNHRVYPHWSPPRLKIYQLSYPRLCDAS